MIGTGEDAGVVVVLAAADVAPSLTGEVFEEGGVAGADAGSSCTATCDWTGSVGTGLDWVAAGELSEGASSLLVDLGRDGAAFSLGVGNEFEFRTVFDATGIGGAGVDGTLEVVFFPAHDEITVTTISSRITHGEHEGLVSTSPLVRIHSCVPEDFVEYTYEVDGELRRTSTAVVGANRVAHMGFVILCIQILPVPAGGEEYLLSETVGTVVVGETSSLWPSWAIVVETSVADSLTSKVIATFTLERITSKHSEARWEGPQLFVFATTL